MSGRVIAIVGPSGVGKDSVMEGLLGALPRAVFVRRVITRTPEAGGEDFDAVSEAEFAAMVDNGAFALHWQAHGLYYGVPRRIKDDAQSNYCLVNLSRTVLREAARLFPSLIVLNVTAKPETLARRLAGRGRETAAEIERRLSHAEKPLPPGLDIRNVSNDDTLAETIAAAARLLAPDVASPPKSEAIQ
ncbi:MAG: phosphonate metabolism protein/1,5-bisphosphokinase (PRPP-forming) PhnN [Pseudomonadota bacterium]